MGCGIAIVKYLVFIFNLIFALIGLTLLVVGVIFRFNVGYYAKSDFDVAPILFIVVGALIFIISFLGCCGAIRESSCMLISYAVLVIIIILIQIGIGAFAFIAVKETVEIETDCQETVQDMFNSYNATVDDKQTFDDLQQSLKCCGVNGPSDWKNNVPHSCCSDNNPSCDVHHHTLYNTGCAEKMYSVLVSAARSIGFTAFGICAVEVIGVIFAFCLVSSIKNQYRRGAYA